MNHMYGSPGANVRTGPDAGGGGRRLGWFFVLAVAVVVCALLLTGCDPTGKTQGAAPVATAAPAQSAGPTCERDTSALPDSYYCPGPAGPYTVRSVDAKALTAVCGSDTASPHARTRLWDPETELEPTVGAPWLCNSPEMYVVKSVEPSEAGAADGFVNVTCVSTRYPDSTKTKQWDALAQPAPVVGELWFCDEDTP